MIDDQWFHDFSLGCSCSGAEVFGPKRCENSSPSTRAASAAAASLFHEGHCCKSDKPSGGSTFTSRFHVCFPHRVPWSTCDRCARFDITASASAPWLP